MLGRQIDNYPRRTAALAAALLALAVWQAAACTGRWQAAACAADDTADAPKSKAKGDKDDAPAPASKRYQVPDTKSTAQLLKFIYQLRDYEPEDAEDAIAYQKQAPQAIKAAAELILKIEKDKSSDAYQTASMLLLANRISTIDEAKPAEQRALIAEITKRISGPDPSQEDYGLALMLARNLSTLEDTKLAADTYNSIGKVLKASKDEQLASLGALLEGAARRIDLVGKPMKVDGRPMDGKPFDWQAYTGKVVLVDFWATWCKPCRAELPNVKRAYREYHSRGFDVVGISIDDDAEALHDFLADEKLPWVTLHDTSKAAEGEHPLASYYGVMGIPTVILVGKDGKVVSLNARGEELWEQLEKLLGPAAKEKSDDEKPSKPDASPKPKGTGK